MACFGGSFGGGILVKAMCVSPDVVSCATLLVPAALDNAPAWKSTGMIFPMIMYQLTHQERWFTRCLLPMALQESNITQDVLETARCSIDHAKIKALMPQNEPEWRLGRYRNPVLVLAAEKDCLFPGEKVLSRVQKVWKQSETCLLRGRGHMHQLTEDEKEKIAAFLLKESV